MSRAGASAIPLLLALAVAAGCGARAEPAPTPPAVEEVAPPDDDVTEPAAPDDAPEPAPDPPPAPADDPPDDEPTTGEPSSNVPVPGPIATLFTLPAEVRVDEAGTSTSGESVEVTQLTGEFLGGGLAEAVRAFDAALAEAGLPPNRDVTPDGAVYVIPIDERTLAIGLVVDADTVFVSVDLLTDRRA